MNAPLPRHQVLERHERVAALGLLLWDAHGGRTADGLAVRAWPADAPDAVLGLASAPSGHYYTQNLPGLRAHELPHPDDPAPAPSDFLIEAVDPSGTLLPARLSVTLPQAGLARPACVAGEAIDLFSAPARSVPAGRAVLRASLRELPRRDDPDAAPRAAWAVLELRQGAALLGRGLADARGEALLPFPWPDPPNLPAGGSPFAHAWTLSLTVRYQAKADPTALPDYCALLAQPAAGIVTAFGAPPTTAAELTLTLNYGRALLAVSPGQRALYVQPA